MEVIPTYRHWEVAELNAARFVTLADYHRLRDAAREVVEAHERDPDCGSKVSDAIAVLEALAAKPTV